MTEYYAICKRCGVGRCVMVNNPVASVHHLQSESKYVQQFLELHGQHDLLLIHSDRDFKQLYEEGWEDYDESEEYKKKIAAMSKEEDKLFFKNQWFNTVRKKV